jgi:arylsulfatase A-like enzyme
LLPACLITAGIAAAQTRPNIVWIWADNLAYGDLGVYGSDRVEDQVPYRQHSLMRLVRYGTVEG